eukprot:7987325-Pyramimonas_sp.AAC.1
MWATLDSNVWGVRGPRKTIIDIGVQYILNNIKEWGRADPTTESSRLVQNLTPGMLGSDTKRTLKTKAAETGALLPWATQLCG